ncbi:MAG: DegT/DnrJ/EryC1/StrS family aminotransferase [Acidimicrobiales bacterium]
MIGDDERTAVDRVLRSGGLAQGPEVAAFESEFAALVEGRRCVALSSGTAALHLALLALGIGPGDEVIVPSFTFAATANVVVLVGAVPVFADIRADTFCIDPDHAASLVTQRTAAIIPVHLYGHPAAMPALRAMAATHGLALVEDAAQAHAASLDGTPTGAWGDAAAFSFYPTKNMTTGEGGMAVFTSEEAARQARLLRNQGMERQYENEIAGYNLRMTDIAAAMGRVQLRRLPDLTVARRGNAHRLSEGLADTVVVPTEAPGAVHVYHQYTVRSDDRDRLAGRLEAAEVQARVYYPTPVHRLPAYDLELDLPETERACAEVLSLPVGPHLRPTDVDRIIEVAAS